MTSYRQTIKRYRRMLVLPIVLTVVLALWSAAGSPKSYQAGASLWVDNLPPAVSSLAPDNLMAVQTPPAEREQAIVSELLSTHEFRLAVARRGPLDEYFNGNPSHGWGPMGLLSHLSRRPALSDQLISALDPKRLTTEAVGPQVLQVSYTGGSPEVAAGTVQALIDELNRRLATFAVQRTRNTVSIAQADVNVASRAVSDARRRTAEYQMENPDAANDDPHLVALLRAQRYAGRELSRATTRLNQVSSGQADSAPGTGFSVIDRPRLPTAPQGGKKRLIMALFGGLFAGLLISGLALIVLTPSRPPLPDGVSYLYEVPDPQEGVALLDREPTGHVR